MSARGAVEGVHGRMFGVVSAEWISMSECYDHKSVTELHDKIELTRRHRDAWGHIRFI